MDELIALIALSRLQGLNTFKKKEIIDNHDRVGSLFEGKTKPVDRDVQKSILSFKAWNEIEREIKKLEQMNVDIITIRDREYPHLLKNIPDPPIVFYKKGSLNFKSNTIAIVGSRKATFTGINLAEKIADTLSAHGITVVSGFARGIDTSAHKGALRGKGKTIAVFGCGIDICYPSENGRLYEKIGEEGTLVTEYGLGEKPLQYHFPERNRIIAGLSKGILVIEATQKSGSLITARCGIEYGRDVMAVPGNIFNDEYKGANALIKQGAKLVDNIEDIIVTCFPDLKFKEDKKGKTNKNEEMNQDENCVYSLIGFGKIHVDEIIEKSKMQTKDVMVILTGLEMKDLVRQFPGGFYIRK